MAAPDPERVLRDVGRRIAELRAGRGLTQERLAELANFTVQYLQRVEAGRENLTVRSLAALAGLVGAQVADLFAAPANREVRPGRPRKPPAVAPTTTPTARASSTPTARRGRRPSS